jgi:hypothetical protein
VYAEATYTLQAVTLTLTAHHESNLLSAGNKKTIFTVKVRLNKRFGLQEQYWRISEVIIPHVSSTTMTFTEFVFYNVNEYKKMIFHALKNIRPFHSSGGQSPASHCGGSGSGACEVMWDLRWTKWHWGRFSPSTSVSPANCHSTDCSTLIICRYPVDRILPRVSMAAVARRTQWFQWANYSAFFSKSLGTYCTVLCPCGSNRTSFGG